MSDRIAIMDRGKIAQTGTPEELYGSPVNAYVADFIGSANTLPVEVESLAGGTMRYRLCGRLLAGVNGGLRPEDKNGILVARPEELSLHVPESTVDNAVPGSVLRRQYLGFKTSYRIRLQDGPEIRVDLSGGRAIDPHPGDSVQVLFPAHSRVIGA